MDFFPRFRHPPYSQAVLASSDPGENGKHSSTKAPLPLPRPLPGDGGLPGILSSRCFPSLNHKLADFQKQKTHVAIRWLRFATYICRGVGARGVMAKLLSHWRATTLSRMMLKTNSGMALTFWPISVSSKGETVELVLPFGPTYFWTHCPLRGGGGIPAPRPTLAWSHRASCHAAGGRSEGGEWGVPSTPGCHCHSKGLLKWPKH